MANLGLQYEGRFQNGAFKPLIRDAGVTCCFSDNTEICIGMNEDTKKFKAAEIFPTWRARRMVETSIWLNRKPVVGYILRHHPSWMRLIAKACDLCRP